MYVKKKGGKLYRLEYANKQYFTTVSCHCWFGCDNFGKTTTSCALERHSITIKPNLMKRKLQVLLLPFVLPLNIRAEPQSALQAPLGSAPHGQL